MTKPIAKAIGSFSFWGSEMLKRSAWGVLIGQRWIRLWTGESLKSVKEL